MNSIEKTDSNFLVKKTVCKKGLKYYNIDKFPFRIYSVFYENGCYRRMPEKVAKSVNSGVHCLHTCTAGGRVRFVTDSSYVALHAEMHNISKMSHFAITGSAGFDVYIKEINEKYERYAGTFVPPLEITNGYEQIVEFKHTKIREITINLPLYSGVKTLFIGLDKSAEILPAPEYKIKKPFVYYGSSITQGGCASRPGNTYQSIISRRFDADYTNLGFSGSAGGEVEIAKYIKGLDMSLFVYDYDYNAPTVKYLSETHERMFKIIREANPTLPIIMTSRPKYILDSDEIKYMEIIKKTYENAVKEGDKNVYFLDGKALMVIAGNDGTVDNCHPNDLGFYSMAKALESIIEKIF